MQKSILTVTLNPAVDKIIQTGRHRITISHSAGGKGLNVSRALKNLGFAGFAAGVLGGRTGNFIKTQLRAEKLPGVFCRIGAETRTNTTVINTETGEIRHVARKGPRVRAKELGNFKRKYTALLRRSSAVVFSGSVAPGMTSSVYGELIRMAKGKNVKTFLDTSGTPLRLGLHAKPFLVKPNLKEAEALLGKKIRSAADIKKAVNSILSSGAGIAVLSLGARGAAASDGRETFLAVPPGIRVRNTVGSGDALLAGFVAAHFRKRSFRDCVRMAVAAGSANALGSVPGGVTKRSVERMFRKIKVEKI